MIHILYQCQKKEFCNYHLKTHTIRCCGSQVQVYESTKKYSWMAGGEKG